MIALCAWKPGQSILQQLGVKSCSIYPSVPKKATNLLALHVTLGAQLGTKFFAATALTILPDPDTSQITSFSATCLSQTPNIQKHRYVQNLH